MINLPRVAARIFGEPLAIERQKLDVIVTAVGPRLRGMPMDDDDEQESAQRQPYTVSVDGIACIDISGTLVAKCSGMNAMSGLTSYADIACDFTAAMSDSAVRAILLHIDSPGGEVKGMFDLASLMNSMRGQKPVCAYVDCAASAAYLLASTAERIVVSSIGLTGSVGVIALHLDESKADEQAGLKYTAIFAGDRKDDGNPHEPLSPEARAGMQARIDTVYGMFISAVAGYRGMSEESVRKTQAAIYMGKDGVNVGFADMVGSPEDAYRALSTPVMRGKPFNSAPSSVPSSVASATNLPKEGTSMPEEKVQAEAKIPTSAEIEAMVSQATQAGRAEAALIANMCAIAGKVGKGKVAEFLSSGKTAAQVGEELLAARVEADKASQINTGVMPGLDASVDANKAHGTAKPWSEIMDRVCGKRGAK